MKKAGKKKQVSPSFKKNSTVYHEVSTFGIEALMSKKFNNSLSSRKSETQVVKDWLKW